MSHPHSRPRCSRHKPAASPRGVTTNSINLLPAERLRSPHDILDSKWKSKCGSTIRPPPRPCQHAEAAHRRSCLSRPSGRLGRAAFQQSRDRAPTNAPDTKPSGGSNLSKTASGGTGRRDLRSSPGPGHGHRDTQRHPHREAESRPASERRVTTLKVTTRPERRTRFDPARNRSLYWPGFVAAAGSCRPWFGPTHTTRGG
jgi:hypothetical protein